MNSTGPSSEDAPQSHRAEPAKPLRSVFQQFPTGIIPPSNRTPAAPATLGYERAQLSNYQRTVEYQRLVEIKRTLRFGIVEPGGNHTEPFRFTVAPGISFPAESPGLEGFLFTERHIARAFGKDASAALLPNYLHHATTLLGRLNGTHQQLQELSSIAASSGPQLKQYVRFITFLTDYVDTLRQEVRALDHSRWSHHCRIYHLFARAFNHQEHRTERGAMSRRLSGRLFTDFSVDDLAYFREGGFDTLRWMGVYPVGELCAKGTAGGSPFAVRRYEVDPQHGTASDVKQLVKMSARLGIRQMFELVLNHTAVDADLVTTHPALFVHTRSRPVDTTGYYFLNSSTHGEIWIRNGGWKNLDTGKREYWTDTLQLDFSNPDTRDLVIAQVKDLIRNYGVQSFRIDSAYQLLNRYFEGNWNGEMQAPLPEREFLDRLISEIKSEFPGVAFIAEAFDGWDDLSECGFDLIYGINDMLRRGGHMHHGWHDSLVSKDPWRIRNALRRAEFLHWQEGGADMLAFFGQHDKTAPWNELGDWKWGAAALTLLKPGALSVYSGTDAEFEAPCKEDRKMITFNEPTRINWKGLHSDFGVFQRKLGELFSRMQDRLGELTFHALEPAAAEESWVGYVITATGGAKGGEKVVVVANPCNEATAVTISRPDLGLAQLTLNLPGCGQESFEIIGIPADEALAH
jgi:glycosidase